MDTTLRPVQWDGDLVLLDQRRLPFEETWVRCTTVADVVRAIGDMVVRGAPAIGCAGGFGVVIAARESGGDPDRFAALCDALAAARPTAVNLSWAVGKVRAAAQDGGQDAALQVAQAILADDEAACRAMGAHGAALLPQEGTVLTHCNAGALATAGWGTALGVIRSAVAAGKRIQVLADETRPRLQGAKLTAWELQRDRIPVTVIPDGAAASLLLGGAVDCVVVGADRIAANGDVCNKIGTLSVALAASAAGVPFYVAAPLSTFDFSCPNGAEIPIEERDGDEVRLVGDQQVVPDGVAVRNPAFDVTPAHLVAAIVTERGVVRPKPSWEQAMAALMRRVESAQ